MKITPRYVVTSVIAGGFILAHSMAFAAGGVITHDQAESVHGGQTRDEVISSLGKPERVMRLRATGGERSLVYDVTPESNMAGQESKLFVDLDASGRVVNATIMVLDGGDSSSD